MGIHEMPALQHWNYFLALDDDVAHMARYLEPTQANFDSYSLELARILFAAASEVDVVSKRLCKKIDENSKAKSINKYREEILHRFPTISSAQVTVPRFGLTLNPWEQWAKNMNPLWWDAYTNVKYHRHTHFADANMKHALNAAAGLFVLLLFYYSKEGEDAKLNPAPVFFRAGPPFHVGTNVFEASESIYTSKSNGTPASQAAWARSALAVVSDFGLLSPVRRPDISPTSGGLGEHCSSSAVGHGVCAPLGRVAQPRLLVKYRGNPEGAARWGRPLLVTFLGKTRKVTCCRATPDGFDFEFGASVHASTSSARTEQRRLRKTNDQAIARFNA